MEKVSFKDVKLYFADNIDHRQYKLLHPKCREIFSLAKLILHLYGFDVIITSMIRPKGTVMMESGIHATGRAIDFVAHVRPGEPLSKNLRLKLMAQKICALVNTIYTRNDSKLTLMYHNSGSGWHFHCQIQWDKSYVGYQGTIPVNHLELGEADEVEFVFRPDDEVGPNTHMAATKAEILANEALDSPQTDLTNAQTRESSPVDPALLEEQSTELLTIEELFSDLQMTKSQEQATGQVCEQPKELSSAPFETPHKPEHMIESVKESIV